MKFNLYWASTPKDKPAKGTVEIKTLEDLENLDKELGNHSLVVDFNDIPSIIVYNDYLE